MVSSTNLLVEYCYKILFQTIKTNVKHYKEPKDFLKYHIFIYRKESTEKAVSDAKERLQKLAKGSIRAIGLELENIPAYLHLRAVTAGFQEYVEARTLCSLMESREIIPYKDVQKELTYIVKTPNENAEGESDDTERVVVTLLPPNEYMLGIADLTGELMRRAINCISSGESEESLFACQTVRALYTGYLGIVFCITSKIYHNEIEEINMGSEF